MANVAGGSTADAVSERQQGDESSLLGIELVEISCREVERLTNKGQVHRPFAGLGR
jgi:hypothetical protein